jgi:predicted glycoside hydrolase/deacetylase ChbG (UPF0249 family)
MSDKRIIVNADDLGMSRGITDGIALAHRHGFLTSASLMVNMRASEYAVTRLAELPRLGVGVHLNICQGRPVLPPREVPSLIDQSGSFSSPSAMIRKLWTRKISPRELEFEFRAQIQWMKNRGIVPTHADSHHHMHIYPAAVRPFIRALSAEGIRCARAPRCSLWMLAGHVDGSIFGRIGGPHAGPLARRFSAQLYRGALQVLELRRLRMPDSRICFRSRGHHDLAALGADWISSFGNLPAGTFELACHPGLFERGFSETDSIHLQREEELRWITSPEWREAIDRNRIRLISYRNLTESRAAEGVASRAPVLP